MANRAKKELWEERVQSFFASGLSRKAWCQEHNLPEHQLGYWLSKLQPDKIESGSNRWVAVESNCFSDPLRLYLGFNWQDGKFAINMQCGDDF